MDSTPRWKIRSRINCFSSLRLKVALLLITLVILVYALATLGKAIIMQPPVELFPMIQFDRGGFTKAEILDSSQHALDALSKLARTENSGGDNADDVPFLKYVLEVEDRRTRRQLLALEALGMSNQNDFEVLASLGYEKPTAEETNATAPMSSDFYKSLSESVQYRTPDYSNLCPHSSFSLTKPHRAVDRSFCSRLKILGQAIEEGREPPLLTIFTWWLDPVNDKEILSRKTMLANWNILRPFIVPVVFTNHRMNMAFANGYGWPCFPVTSVNSDGLPVFKTLSDALTRKFTSTFYGYAKPIALFDWSLLETLMAIKDHYVGSRNRESLHHTTTAGPHPVSLPPVVIHGCSIKMPHILSPEHFVNFQRLSKYLQVTPLRGGKLSVEKANYLFYSGVDFSQNMPPLVIHDNYLFRFAVEFSVNQSYAVINTSKTLLAVQTFRPDTTNEWGRRCLSSKVPDPSYNLKLAAAWYSALKVNHKTSQRPKLLLSTRFEPRNNSCVLDVSSQTVHFN